MVYSPGGLVVIAVTLTTITFLLISTIPDALDYAQSRNASKVNPEKLNQLTNLLKEHGLPPLIIHDGVCLEDGCFDSAIDILSKINSSLDPCKDFYRYVCSRLISTEDFTHARRIKNKTMQKYLDILQEDIDPLDVKPINQARELYMQGNDKKVFMKEYVPFLHQVVNHFGGWELLDPQGWNESEHDWLLMMAEMAKWNFQRDSALIYVDVGTDFEDTTKRAIYISPPAPSFLLAQPDLKEIYSIYAFGTSLILGSTQNYTELRRSIDEMVTFELKLARITPSEISVEKLTSYTLPELQSVTDEMEEDFRIDWSVFLHEVFNSSGVKLSPNERIIVGDIAYFSRLISLLKEEDKRIVRNYMMWKVIFSMCGGPKESIPVLWKLKAQMENKTETIPPTYDGLSYGLSALNIFSMAIGMKFVDEDVKNEVGEMAEKVRDAFRGMLENASWVTNKTIMEGIRGKLEKVRMKLMYPDWVANRTAVEEYYEGFELGDWYLESVVGINRYQMHRKLEGLRKDVDGNEWGLHQPPDSAAIYDMQGNSVLITAGFLQPPTFFKDRPMHEKYGQMGFVIGHEIAHGFDFHGLEFDKNGNFKSLLDNQTKREFLVRASPIADQYRQYYYVRKGRFFSRKKTLAENIADNVGLRASYSAYQLYGEEHGKDLRLPGLEHFSTEQLFFIGFAKFWCESPSPEDLERQLTVGPHAPSEFRVNGALRNNDNFANAFGCPVDEKGMNPPSNKKAIFW